MAPLILLALMAVMGYMLLIRPARAQKRVRAEMMAQLREGSEILTVGGIYGTVTDVREDELDVEIADGVVVRLNRRAIANVLSEPAQHAEDVAGDVADEQAD